MANGSVHDLTFEWEGLTLTGSLHLPAEPAGDADSGWPVVLMLQGSGPADRDSDGYFPEIRATFLDRGIAAYSFDKPGCGSSTGDWQDYALAGRAEQADAALSVLAEHPALDETRRAVWGQSQGGWLVQILAGRRNDLAFAVANSGPSISVQKQDLFGCEHTLRSEGVDEEAIKKALALVGQTHQAANRGDDFPSVKQKILDPIADEPWYRYFVTAGAKDWHQIRLFAEEDYQPLQSLATVSGPFLAIYGGQDVLVPAWQGATETGKALADAPTEDAAVVVFPTGNHRLQDDDGFVPGYLDLLGDWAAARVTSEVQASRN